MASSALPLRVRSAYICPSCRHRSFSAAASRAAIAPESPRYIDIPEPPQQTKPDRLHQKGILPIPRDVAGRTPKKSIVAATRGPAIPRTPSSDPSLAFKAAQAALRKENLASGYAALSSRRTQRITENRERSQRNRDNREALLSAPERDADRLTSITLDPSVQAELDRMRQGGPTPDPGRLRRLNTARARLAVHERQKREARQDALHTLYMNARKFIVDEEGLNKAIDDAFGTENDPHRFPGGKPSMWGHGAPPKMQDMVAHLGGVGRSQLEGGLRDSKNELLKQRLKRMAEVVTGGKMD
ncbi:hypothetical protein BDZ85DRAFT_262267 [Elsinoe ampelina]|uniref:Uncharacterized protein n=1 Tax=Elsinoe ampelina TaxID=302913 RepID=A0A6A6GDS1_9PEZI|nr:hypothetical protein BDZ85DRAFT_262267 [Elsinoe ampelina]